MRFVGEQVRLLELQKRYIYYDDYNQPIDVWLHQGEFYAEKIDRQGKVTDVDGALVAQQDIRFFCRYRDINKADYRIVEGSDIYEIENIQYVGRRAMYIMCRLNDINYNEDDFNYLLGDGELLTGDGEPLYA